MSGGEVFGTLYSYDKSIFNMTSGIVHNLYSYEFSTANISGNTPDSPFNIVAWDQSIINFSATAQAEQVYALNKARINITGGEIDALSAYNDGVINIYSGDIKFNVWAQDNAAINIFGYDLFKSPTGGTGNGFVQGYYNDHSYFNFNFEGTATYSHVNLIPEPATILLLVAGGLFLRKKE
jgi:outer membrane protein assembly factor BamB